MGSPSGRDSAPSRGKRLARGIDIPIPIPIPIPRTEGLPAIGFEAQEYGGLQRPQQQFTGRDRAVVCVFCATMDEDRIGARICTKAVRAHQSPICTPNRKSPTRPMMEKRRVRWIHELFAGKSSQCLAFSFCLLFGLAMIANTQLSGEATWFWYAALFHGGVKLYADLHLVLQPLYILEMNVWMNLFGKKLLVTEIPSILHLVVLCLGMLLLLRESDWPDWQNAIVLAAVFIFWTAAISYRFDDFHVTTESFALYSVILLLQVAKSDQRRRQLFLAAALGVLSGFAMTSRVNDGAALLAATLLCLPF